MNDIRRDNERARQGIKPKILNEIPMRIPAEEDLVCGCVLSKPKWRGKRTSKSATTSLFTIYHSNKGFIAMTKQAGYPDKVLASTPPVESVARGNGTR